MANNDVYKLAFVGRFGTGQQFVTGMHYRQIGASTLPGARALAEAVGVLHGTDFTDLISLAYILDTIQTRQVNAPATEGYDYPVGIGGSISGDPIPPMDCVVITKLTGLVGRRYRGRFYMPAPVESEQSAGSLEVTKRAAWQAFVDLILDIPAQDGSGATFQAVIWHKDLAISTDVTAFLVRNVLGTQRRRRAGVGS